jgi:hypothetical protein
MRPQPLEPEAEDTIEIRRQLVLDQIDPAVSVLEVELVGTVGCALDVEHERIVLVVQHQAQAKTQMVGHGCSLERQERIPGAYGGFEKLR